MLRIFTLLVIAICIPLLHLFYLIGIATIFLSLQLYIIFNRNLFKYKIQKYLRILHTVCFLLFNWNFLGLYILQYYPNINIEISSKIGLATIILLLIIYVLDLPLYIQKHLLILKITNYEIADSRTPKKE